MITLGAMAKPRRRPAPLPALGEDYLAIWKESQRVMLTRLRSERGRRLFGVRYLTQEAVAARAGFSVDHLRDLESGDTPLGDEMRVRLMLVYGLTPTEWAEQEASVVEEVEGSGVNLRIHPQWVADGSETEPDGEDGTG